MKSRNMPPGIQVPTIGQQRQSAEAAIGQAVQQLSLQLYSRVASDYLGGQFEEPADPEHLRRIARDSHAAAKAFFEGLGIAQFEVPTNGQA